RIVGDGGSKMPVLVEVILAARLGCLEVIPVDEPDPLGAGEPEVHEPIGTPVDPVVVLNLEHARLGGALAEQTGLTRRYEGLGERRVLGELESGGPSSVAGPEVDERLALERRAEGGPEEVPRDQLPVA